MTKVEKQARVPKAQRWGKSLAIRLPATLLTASGIREGTSLEIINKDDGLLIRPAQKKKKTLKYINPYSESGLLKGLTPETAHSDELLEEIGEGLSGSWPA